MNRVTLQTDELNLRSRRAIEKIGGKLEGILRQDKVTWNGRVRSSAVYSVLRTEWLTSGARREAVVTAQAESTHTRGHEAEK